MYATVRDTCINYTIFPIFISSSYTYLVPHRISISNEFRKLLYPILLFACYFFLFFILCVQPFTRGYGDQTPDSVLLLPGKRVTIFSEYSPPLYRLQTKHTQPKDTASFYSLNPRTATQVYFADIHILDTINVSP